MAVYYIDYNAGSAENNGLSRESPFSRVEDCSPVPGDTVLIKRGSFVRGALHAVSGDSTAQITYDAYGEGENPIFCGSIDASDETDWEICGDKIWRCTKKFDTEPCNIIFNNGGSFGNMRWEMSDLDEQGEWFDPDGGKTESRVGYPADGTLYLYSEENPGKFYEHIEIAVYGERMMCRGTNLILKNITFMGSGVHGFAGQPDNTIISGCKFIMIGGCVWNRDLKIRFGNAVEFWEHGENVTVEHCLFKEIYDSCVTHQGFANVKPVSNIRYEHNLFINFGMAAYELRDLIPINTTFNDNICIGAGEGFAAQGELPPRQSEIWPQPMGHHIFMWRVKEPSENGSLEIKRNIFYNAPVGAAIYSIDEPGADIQADVDFNIYWTENDSLLQRWNGKCYTPAEFEKYQAESGVDAHSRYEKPDIDALVSAWECI